MGVGSNPTSDIDILVVSSSNVLGRHDNIQSDGYQSKNSRVAQWKRAGPITQRSVDRNHALLKFFLLINSNK